MIRDKLKVESIEKARKGSRELREVREESAGSKYDSRNYVKRQG
jgi:hypothetical protein